jgi:hypothetical protein
VKVRGKCNCITILFSGGLKSLMALALRLLILHNYLQYFIFTFLTDFDITSFYVKFNKSVNALESFSRVIGFDPWLPRNLIWLKDQLPWIVKVYIQGQTIPKEKALQFFEMSVNI